MEMNYNQLLSFAYTLENVDWSLLYKQKMGLVDVIGIQKDNSRDNFTTMDDYMDDLRGILHLLDALMDDAEAAGLFVHPGPTEN